MFDFAWSEIALIGVVALVAIGPKDMPVAIKTIADLVKKGRRMAGEFQTHVDEMVREANLHEVRDQINDLRSLNLRDQFARTVDRDGSLRRSLADDPLKPGASPPGPAPAGSATAADPATSPATTIGPAGTADAAPGNTIGTPRPALLQPVPPPSFLPPGAAQPEAAARPMPAASPVPAPAFIPPGAAMPEAVWSPAVPTALPAASSVVSDAPG